MLSPNRKCPNSNPRLLDDHHRSRVNDPRSLLEGTRKAGDHARCVGVSEPEYHHTGRLTLRERRNLPEVEIKRQDDTALGNCLREYGGVA